MKNEQSNSYSQLEFSHYYQLNNDPETMLLMKKTRFNSTVNRKDCTSVSEQEIMVALGFIISLLLLSSWQLYRSFDISPKKAMSNSEQALVKKIAKQELEQERNKPIIELQFIQNIISHGKF